LIKRERMSSLPIEISSWSPTIATWTWRRRRQDSELGIASAPLPVELTGDVARPASAVWLSRTTRTERHACARRPARKMRSDGWALIPLGLRRADACSTDVF